MKKQNHFCIRDVYKTGERIIITLKMKKKKKSTIGEPPLSNDRSIANYK